MHPRMQGPRCYRSGVGVSVMVLVRMALPPGLPIGRASPVPGRVGPAGAREWREMSRQRGHEASGGADRIRAGDR
jgi:hypothetical protein